MAPPHLSQHFEPLVYCVNQEEVRASYPTQSPACGADGQTDGGLTDRIQTQPWTQLAWSSQSSPRWVLVSGPESRINFHSHLQETHQSPASQPGGRQSLEDPVAIFQGGQDDLGAPETRGRRCRGGKIKIMWKKHCVWGVLSPATHHWESSRRCPGAWGTTGLNGQLSKPRLRKRRRLS